MELINLNSGDYVSKETENRSVYWLLSKSKSR